ncbi:unnamed protein product [Penicillium camemberti]|uniref:Str. FM013 n=1 Tax=Penicillium camemberti (strain FM 013) TaxID=1429867 RepID=A0A0G4P9C5_PENC3|nr:unnamed protein product [Penicillium camemberti]
METRQQKSSEDDTKSHVAQLRTDSISRYRASFRNAHGICSAQPSSSPPEAKRSAELCISFVAGTPGFCVRHSMAEKADALLSIVGHGSKRKPISDRELR